MIHHKIRLRLLYALFLLSSISGTAQTQEQTVLLYNISFGAITAAVGSVINKPKGTNWRKALVRGLWQGAIGGGLNYSSKKTLYLINKHQNIIYGLPAKILHSAGNSIVESAAYSEPFLQNWNIDYGLIRIDFSINKPENFKVRLLPEAVYASMRSAHLAKLNVKESFTTGTMVFTNKSILPVSNPNVAYGQSTGRAIAYVNNVNIWPNQGQLKSHELIHTYQYKEYQIFNAWLRPLARKIKSPLLQTTFTKYVYPDIPYFLAAYHIAGNYTNPHYFRNFYEFEAQRFSTNSLVHR